ncbi:LOW QUALITY PROTEIN: Polyprotein [Phytophthora palmivora]|uniref:Polyprotein n=1 Tax=Phytophthora palmivora TaxID=4796 RepID=A0A2P4XGR8_9STRA|nr:LOW QUALITY PROTEIN: Polyprotein [Phytophthora palmivora]
MDSFGLGVVAEPTPVSTGGLVAESEGVVASGEPIERAGSSVGETISLSSSGNDNDDDSDEGASFRHTMRITTPNVRLRDYEVDLREIKAALEAADFDKWIEALNNEYRELLRNKTWELVERTEGAKVLTSKWVFVRKRNPQGQVELHRARITVRGCQQKYGLNFSETYAPVIGMVAVRLGFLLALRYGLFCRYVDFVIAFLIGPIDVEIYMSQPEFFDDGTGRITSKPVWFKVGPENIVSNIEQVLKIMDGDVYFRWVNGSPIFLTLYVDGIVIAVTMENIKLVLTELERKFKIKDLGDSLLAMAITYVPGISISISQRGYIGQLLERFKMASCKAVSTPQAKGTFPCQQDPDRETVCVNIDPDVDYQCIVGSLQYLVSCSKPDTSNAVRILGKFLTCYTKEHFVLAKRVLRYLQSTRDYGLLIANADTDQGNEKDDRCSVTGYVLQLNGCTFAYKSKKQPIMTNGTCSAGFVAARECSNMSCERTNYLQSIRQTIRNEDNQAAIKVIGEVSSNYEVKSVDLKFHKIRDFVSRKVFRVKYCASDESVADIFTKPLGPQHFRKLRQNLNVLPVPINK